MAMCENRGFLRVGRSSRGRHGDVRKTLAFSLVFVDKAVVTTSSWRCAKIVGFHWFLMVGRSPRRRHGDVRKSLVFIGF